MKNLIEIINEKILINKDIQKQEIKVGTIDPAKKSYINRMMWVKSPSVDYQDEIKMKEYFKKGSKPQRLANSIKDINKLFRRWMVAIRMQWDECIQVFGEEIDKRQQDITLQNLHEYIFDQYKRYKNIKLSRDKYIHYFELYGLTYDENN